MATPLAFQLAYDAIEEFVANRHPDYSGYWQTLIPEEVWKYTAPGWDVAASTIVGNFNRRLPAGSQISVPATEKQHALGVPLVEFQRFLAALADRVSSDVAVRTLVQARAR